MCTVSLSLQSSSVWPGISSALNDVLYKCAYMYACNYYRCLLNTYTLALYVAVKFSTQHMCDYVQTVYRLCSVCIRGCRVDVRPCSCGCDGFQLVPLGAMAVDTTAFLPRAEGHCSSTSE